MAGLIILDLIAKFLFFFIAFTYIVFIGIANSDQIDGRLSLHDIGADKVKLRSKNENTLYIDDLFIQYKVK